MDKEDIGIQAKDSLIPDDITVSGSILVLQLDDKMGLVVIDEEVSKGKIFGGHASGKFSITHFRPSSDEKYCLCGHSDYDHEWIKNSIKC